MGSSTSKSSKEGRLHLRIEPEVLEEMRRFAKHHNLSLSAWCMVAFSKLLQEERYADGPADAEQV